MDCVRVLPGARCASKSADGRVVVWRTGGAAPAQCATFRVAGCAAGDGARGLFGTTGDGNVLVAGGNAGDAHAYDTQTGAKMATFSTGKVRAPVLACAVSDDCRNVLAAFGTGLIARWELIAAPDKAAAADAAEE